MEQDYYDVLGVQRGADPETIKAAYRKLAKEHPEAVKGLIAAISVAVLVLAVIGATAGWLIADRPASEQVPGSGTPTPDASTAEPSQPPIAEPSAVPTSGAANTGGFTLPDVRTMDFEQARRRLRDLHRSVYRNDDRAGYRLARRVLDGGFPWLQDNIVSVWRDRGGRR